MSEAGKGRAEKLPAAVAASWGLAGEGKVGSSRGRAAHLLN